MRLAEGPLYEKSTEHALTLGGTTVASSEFELHLLVITVFVAFVAPFGGFLFSGLKRAMRQASKDNNVNFEGGVISRIECIIVTGCFMLAYMHMLVVKSSTGVEAQGPDAVLSMLDYMSEDAQRELYIRLKADLVLASGL